MAYDYLFKIIVVGDTGCGKSCSVAQLCQQRFEPEHHLTIGVEFASQTLPVRNHLVKVQIWDTAGQESFRSITRAYYRGATGVILLYDITQRHTFESLPHWLEELHQLCHAKCSILLVGHKSDLDHQREVTRAEGEAWAKEHHLLFCETSAKINHQWHQHFQMLLDHIDQRLESGDILPGEETGIRLGYHRQQQECQSGLSLEPDHDGRTICHWCGW